MKKLIVIFLFVFSLSFFGNNVFSESMSVTKADCMIFYNNKILNFVEKNGSEVPLFEYNDKIYVPLRLFNEQIGNQVEWSSGLYSSDIKINDIQNQKHSGKQFGEYSQGADTLQVSIINLIANPDKYYNKHIMLQGIINIEFESDYLFLTENDRKYLNYKNGIGLAINNTYKLEKLKTTYEELREITGEYCTLEGDFLQSGNDDEGFLSNINLIFVDDSFY